MMNEQHGGHLSELDKLWEGNDIWRFFGMKDGMEGW